MIAFILVAGILTFLIDFLFFYWHIGDIDKARTMAVTASIIFQMFLVFNCQSDESIFKSKINKYLVYAVLFSIVLQIVAVYTPLGNLFSFTALSAMDWMKIVGLSIIGFFAIEGFKFYSRRKS